MLTRGEFASSSSISLMISSSSQSVSTNSVATEVGRGSGPFIPKKES